MDVRLFAFLARQRSAKIQPREQFCGLPKRGVSSRRPRPLPSGVNAPVAEAVDSDVRSPNPSAQALELGAQDAGVRAPPRIPGITRLPDSQYTSKPHIN
jgi:hypothetical protein